MSKERFIYHFTERETFEKAKQVGYYKPIPFERDGFIHCSTKEQVLTVANFIAPKDGDLVLLEIDSEKVNAEIIYENLEGGEKLFPHIYGHLPLTAVIRVSRFAPDTQGTFAWPTEGDVLT